MRWIKYIREVADFYHDQEDIVTEVVETNKNLADFLKTKPEKAQYWNNKYKKRDISYKRPVYQKGQGWQDKNIDVRQFIINRNFKIEGILKTNDLLNSEEDWNKKVPKIYQLAKKFYNYEYDSKNLGRSEFWLFPYEILSTKTGDCEDWANLIISFLRIAGLPAWRIRNVCGLTWDGQGHSTVYVLDDDLETWRHLNSTTPSYDHPNLTDYPHWGDQNDSIGIDDQEVWFAFNDRFAWQEFETAGSTRKFRKHPIHNQIIVSGLN